MITYEPRLIPATLVRRYKRFLADIRFPDGTEAVAHCANSGSMMGCAEPGSDILVSANTNPKAKLDWRWEMVRDGDTWICINTSRPNRLVENAIAARSIAQLAEHSSLKREVKYGTNSRIDLLLEQDGQQIYIEIKNVTLKRTELAEFPDAVTARGTKHLAELSDMVAAGHRAIMFYAINRNDCQAMTTAKDIDPAYAKALKRAQAAGVELIAYDVDNGPDFSRLGKPIEVMV